MVDNRKIDAPEADPDAQPEAGPDTSGHPPDHGEDDAGRPVPRDAIDPELIVLPRTRTPIGPMLSISIIAFCIFIMVRMYPDLRFSLQGESPRTFDSAAALLGSDQRADNRFVQLRAVPDRSYAVRVAASKADPGSRLAPAQGTGGNLWVLLDGSVWTAGIRYQEIYTGRLRRLRDLPFAETLRQHLAERPPAPRFVRPVAARAALAARAGTVSEPAGDRIPVAEDTPVRVYETAGDAVYIDAVASERQPTAEAWALALAELGLVPPGTGDAAADRPPDMPESIWRFSATVPGGADAARARLEEAKLFSASVTPVKAEHETTWGQLAGQGDDLILMAGKPVPWDRVDWISLSVVRTLPDDAWVLLVEEHPEAYWYVLPLFVVLGIFGSLFLWALVRTARPRQEDAITHLLSSPPPSQPRPDSSNTP